MTIRWGYAASAVGYIAMGFIMAKMFNLTGDKLYFFLMIWSALGLSFGALFIWLWGKMKGGGASADGSAAPAADTGGSDEIDLLIRDAEARLSASKLAGAAGIGNLPLIYLVGPQGGVKTNTVLNSGLEPELLAGQIYQENNVVAPTRSANLWFARNAIFAEVGSAVFENPTRWTRMIRKLKPGSLKSVMGGKQQAPRAAVLCFDTEQFVRLGAGDQIAALARTMQSRLGQVSETLGISFPVYVLFTRADRVPFFTDYISTLSNDEAAQVFGITLPIRSNQSTGVYGEEETHRLNAAFNALFHSLCDKRLDFMPRENDASKLPGAFEFPREFRKMRTAVVQFLVDVCRPSQLRASPFLRGFYFSGVRPVIVTENIQPVMRPEAQQAHSAGATGMFHTPQFASQSAAAAAVPGTKKVPQWVFLPHLFHHVVLQDRAAMGASGSSVKTSKMQRVLLAIGAILMLICCIGFTVSWFNNRALEKDIVEAAKSIPAWEDTGSNVPPMDGLKGLDRLRQHLLQLSDWNTNGAPWSYRWLLYSGEGLYPEARQAYYNNFHRLLFGKTQKALHGTTGSPGGANTCDITYRSLKGYLITTSNHDKSTVAFLSPLLMQRWTENRNPEPPTRDLAKTQFDFYSDDLRGKNPYSDLNDAGAVDGARKYLATSCGIEAVYQSMLADAARNNQAVNYNRKFPETVGVVTNDRDVSGAFTKGGWGFMQGAFKKIDQYYGGEEWVLGNYKSADLGDRAKLEGMLRDRYTSDFITAWRTYFKNSSVLPYANLKDAATKLNKQSGIQSPILELFWLASLNTDIDNPKVRDAFQAIHFVTPPTPDRITAPSNQPYLNSLISLQTSIDQAANAPGGVPDQATAGATLSSATNARSTVKQAAQNFRIDQEVHLEARAQDLLERPITNAEGLLRGLGPKEMNGKGPGFCALFNLYPLNPAARTDATPQDVVRLLKPGEGEFWKFYEANLKQLMGRQGNQFVAAPGGAMQVNPAFLTFMNEMAKVSDAFFRGGQDPKLSLNLTPLKSEGIQNLVFNVNGQAWNIPPQGGPGKQFTVPGTGSVVVSIAGQQYGNPFQGPWAVLRLLDAANKFDPSGSNYHLVYFFKSTAEFGRVGGSSAQGAPAEFTLDMGGVPAFFRNGPQGLHCTTTIAR